MRYFVKYAQKRGLQSKKIKYFIDFIGLVVPNYVYKNTHKSFNYMQKE